MFLLSNDRARANIIFILRKIMDCVLLSLSFVFQARKQLWVLQKCFVRRFSARVSRTVSETDKGNGNAARNAVETRGSGKSELPTPQLRITLTSTSPRSNKESLITATVSGMKRFTDWRIIHAGRTEKTRPIRSRNKPQGRVDGLHVTEGDNSAINLKLITPTITHARAYGTITITSRIW